MPQPRLLVVEDDKTIADLISHAARKAGFLVEVAMQYGVFKQVYETFQPEVLALDIIMPDMDGFEVLDYLSERKCKARILIISGQDTFRQMAVRMADAKGLAVAGSLAKPFRIAVLKEMFDEIRHDVLETRPRDPAPHTLHA